MNTNRVVESHRYEIMNGPSKDRLFDACKYAYDDNARISLDFSVAIGYTMPRNDPGCAYIAMAIRNLRITGVQHEDGSGESFILYGYCSADPRAFNPRSVCYRSYKFEAYYNTKTRKGSIKLIE